MIYVISPKYSIGMFWIRKLKIENPFKIIISYEKVREYENFTDDNTLILRGDKFDFPELEIENMIDFENMIDYVEMLKNRNRK